MNILELLIGRRLANRERDDRKISWVEAAPAMGLDGLGSASYGPEAALTVLAPLGAASVAWIGWVMAPILALLLVLNLSYRQTVAARALHARRAEKLRAALLAHGGPRLILVTAPWRR